MIREKSISASSARIMGKAVKTPWPISDLFRTRWICPSGWMRIQALKGSWEASEEGW